MGALTNSNNEIVLNDILDGKTQIEVPYYQRAYKWNKKQIAKLANDLEDLFEADDDAAHFMGATIVYQTTPSSKVARRYFVIDGQQRLTSLTLLLLAISFVMAKNDETESARNLLSDRLVLLRRHVEERSNFALIPGAQDRVALNEVVQKILSTRSLSDELSTDKQFVPLETHGGAPKSRVVANFNELTKWVDTQWEMGGLDRLEGLVDLVLQQLTFVEIFVKDPLSGPIIFDRLNSLGEPLSIAELVKNDVFSRGNVPFEELATLDRAVWKPFADKFADPKLLEDYFFPLGLCWNPTLKKGDVYSNLQQRWTSKKIESDPTRIVEELSSMTDDYLTAIRPGHASMCHEAGVALEFDQILSAGAPAAVTPFLMQVSFHARHQSLTASKAIEVLKTVQTFLVRRAICGIEPTGLHAVFKGLWQSLDTTERKLESRFERSLQTSQLLSGQMILS